MPRIAVLFDHLDQDEQVLGTADDYVTSRVVFTISVDGVAKVRCSATIKQPAGADYRTAALGVGPPLGYRGPFSQHVFREAAEAYYREAIGTMEKMLGIRFGPNPSLLQNTVMIRKRLEFDADPMSGGTW